MKSQMASVQSRAGRPETCCPSAKFAERPACIAPVVTAGFGKVIDAGPEAMKPHYIKLTSKSVEATGRYVPHAIWSFLALRILGWAAWLTLALAAGGSALGLAMRALRPALM